MYGSILESPTCISKQFEPSMADSVYTEVITECKYTWMAISEKYSDQINMKKQLWFNKNVKDYNLKCTKMLLLKGVAVLCLCAYVCKWLYVATVKLQHTSK